MNEDKPHLYYIYDPLCGWCYGFSPVMKEIHHEWHDKINIETISGGMKLDDRVGPLNEIAPYIRDAYKRVEDLSGVKFGEPFLTELLGDGNIMLNSWPGSLAMTIFKSYQPENAVFYASDLQSAIYEHGKSSEDFDHFAALAENYGIEKTSFLEKKDDQVFHYATRQDFLTAKNLQASGFPTVILKKGEEYFLLARGFTRFEDLNERIKKVLGE